MLLRGLVLTLLFVCSSVVAKTSLWQVSDGERTLYLGGTIHMLADTDFPLPQEFDRAYRSADRLVFETDLHQLSEPAFQQQLIQQVSFTNGKTLKTALSPTTYQKVQSFLAERGLSISMFEKFKPSMVSISLSVLEMKRLGLTATGVDQHFFQRSQRDGKPTGQLETPAEQIRFIASMGEDNADELLLNTLRDLENLQAILTEIKQSWREGEEQRLVRAALVPMQQDYPQLYDTLLVERNNNWLPRIVAMLDNGETEMVLVGALHLVGEHGLLTQLKARGFSVQLVH